MHAARLALQQSQAAARCSTRPLPPPSPVTSAHRCQRRRPAATDISIACIYTPPPLPPLRRRHAISPEEQNIPSHPPAHFVTITPRHRCFFEIDDRPMFATTVPRHARQTVHRGRTMTPRFTLSPARWMLCDMLKKSLTRHDIRHLCPTAIAARAPFHRRRPPRRPLMRYLIC